MVGLLPVTVLNKSPSLPPSSRAQGLCALPPHIHTEDLLPATWPAAWQRRQLRIKGLCGDIIQLPIQCDMGRGLCEQNKDTYFHGGGGGGPPGGGGGGGGLGNGPGEGGGGGLGEGFPGGGAFEPRPGGFRGVRAVTR